MKNSIDYLMLFGSILVSLGAGFIGSFFTVDSISTWYVTLNKPFFNPPNFLFGPVWTVLYVLMGIALYLVWSKGFKSKESKIAIWLFVIQLVLNTLWSIIFFGLENPLWAFVEIVFLWVAILLTMIYFWKISKPATYLLVPYILWVSFAAVLNFSIYYLN